MVGVAGTGIGAFSVFLPTFINEFGFGTCSHISCIWVVEVQFNLTACNPEPSSLTGIYRSTYDPAILNDSVCIRISDPYCLRVDLRSNQAEGIGDSGLHGPYLHRFHHFAIDYEYSCSGRRCLLRFRRGISAVSREHCLVLNFQWRIYEARVVDMDRKFPFT
jgi:hypothetical protein